MAAGDLSRVFYQVDGAGAVSFRHSPE
jgi:hypothetical protein